MSFFNMAAVKILTKSFMVNPMMHGKFPNYLARKNCQQLLILTRPNDMLEA